MNKIDLVIPWVDGSDKKWQKQKAEYENDNNDSDSRSMRYRDWDTLKYVFRGIEKHMPWIDKVFFISEGHIPEWLNLENEKLIFTKHKDYIPDKYLPTFSSHPIELNLHRISELSEYFVYFNDDMFIIDDISEGMFFKNNKPVYPAILHANTSDDKSNVMPYIYLNNNLVINKYFNKEKLLENKKNWFSLTDNGFRSVIENIFNSRYPQIIGFYNSHLPTPLLKSTIEELWNKEEELLNEASSHKFRNKNDVSQYLFRYWDLARNNFYPINPKKLGKEIDIKEDNMDRICETIVNRRCKMICLNDVIDLIDDRQFELLKQKLIKSFETILPYKSGFEK